MSASKLIVPRLLPQGSGELSNSGNGVDRISGTSIVIHGTKNSIAYEFLLSSMHFTCTPQFVFFCYDNPSIIC